MIFDDSETRASDRAEQVIDALQTGDKDALKSLFSEKAISEADDFDGSVDYLFNFFQGNVISWNQDTFSSDEHIDYGKSYEKLITWNFITTDQGTYEFFMIDYNPNTIDPSNEGIYTLRLIKAEDTETEINDSKAMEIPGIYVPDDQKTG